MDPLDLEHRTYFPARCHGATRTAGAIDWLVIHDTEGDTGLTGAESTARYFQTATDGSAHLVVDDDSTERCLDDLVIACGVRGSNGNTIHVEQSGRAAWTRDEWLIHVPTIQRAAYKVAEWCKLYSVPAVWLEPVDLIAGKSGITSHNNLTQAFHGSTHTDPGPNYPVDIFMAYVAEYLGGGDDWMTLFSSVDDFKAAVAAVIDDSDIGTMASQLFKHVYQIDGAGNLVRDKDGNPVVIADVDKGKRDELAKAIAAAVNKANGA
jgi:hypothetical protein